jgi:hypothetical protein
MSAFQAYIQERVDNKPFDYHRNDTSVSGILRNRSGDEYFFDGATGVADIAELDDYVAEIIIPYTGHYRRKHFNGLRDEYTEERKDVNGKYKVKLTMDMLHRSLDDLGFVETAGDAVDPNHDSHQSAKDGLFEDIVPVLTRS